MRRPAALLAGVVCILALSASQASASELTLTQAGGATFPQRAFLLSLGSRGVVTSRQVTATESGVPVKGLSVEPASKIDQSHFGTVLVIDTSDSMNGVAESSAIDAARAFVRARNPAQPVGIVFFDQTPRVVAPMTTDDAVLNKALASIPALHSGTHMFDATSSAIGLIAGAHLIGGSVVVVSDGRDTGSTASERGVATAAATNGVRVYTVGVRDSSFDGSTLQSLASATRGVYTPVDSTSLVSLYHELGVALSNQYLIQYKSRSPLGSKVVVAVHVTGHGSARTTYTVPAASPVVSSAPSAGSHTSFLSSTPGALLVSLVCALLIGLAILALLSRRVGVRERVGAFVGLTPRAGDDRPRSLVQRALGEPRSRRIDGSRWMTELAEDIEVAQVRIAAPRLVLLTVAATILIGYLLITLQGPVAGLAALLVPLAVRIGVRTLASRKRREFSEQLPDNLSVVASALRAGNTFAGSLGVVASDAPEPSRRELKRALADEQLGVPLVDALNKISERMKSSDFRHVALVATLQQETGGNTAEVLDVVTETIRDRLELRRLVRTLTAQGRLAGFVLSFLPVGVLLALSVINPGYVSPLFHQTAGIIALIFAACLVLLGSFLIRRIVDIDV